MVLTTVQEVTPQLQEMVLVEEVMVKMKMNEPERQWEQRTTETFYSQHHYPKSEYDSKVLAEERRRKINIRHLSCCAVMSPWCVSILATTIQIIDVFPLIAPQGLLSPALTTTIKPGDVSHTRFNWSASQLRSVFCGYPRELKLFWLRKFPVTCL